VQEKKNLIVVAVVAVVLILGGGFFVLSNRGGSDDDSVKTNRKVVQSIDPEEIGLVIVPSADKRYVTFKITHLDDIKSLEWEFTYDADNPEPGEGGEKRITQGFGGEADIESGQSEFESEKRELGTCSTGGKCRFDTGIEEINLIVKITKNDGNVYQAETSTEL
jgi:hypothetical protein